MIDCARCITGQFSLVFWLEHGVLHRTIDCSYSKEWLRPDVIAGLTTAAVVIPKAMAYATIAGLPVQVGLYTAFLPMIIYAVLGTSRALSVSTTTTLAILTAAELGEVVPNGDAASLLAASATLTLLVGGMLVLASVLRLGFVANFISEPVLIGFKAGIGAVIVVDQVPKILGVHFARGTFVQNLLSTVRGIPQTSLATLAVGSLDDRAVGRDRAFRAQGASSADRGCGWHRWRLLPEPARTRRRTGRPHPAGPALVHASGPIACSSTLAGRVGHRPDEFHRDNRGRPCFRRSDEPSTRPNRELLATGLANAGGALSARCPAVAALRRPR